MALYLVKCLCWYMVLMVLINETKGCLEEEREGLLAFKAFLESNTGEDDKDLLPSWVGDRESECCKWERVTCNSSTGHVTELSLNMTMQTSFDGNTIWLLDLTLFQPFKNLKVLNLSSNGLVGWNQDEGSDYFPRLKMLETLDLSNNNLNESIIRSVASLYSLKNLNVAINQLEGSLPFQELSKFRNLEMLNLSFNGLDGSLVMAESKSISRLKNLKTLDISFNEFDISIIQSLSPLMSLENLFLAGNQLEGPLPIKELSVFKNLETLDLSNNALTVPLRTQDSTYLSKLTKLKTVDLSSNYLAKEILWFLGALPALRTLYIYYNTMNGHLSDKEFTGLRNLEVLMLRGCGLNGTLPNNGICSLKNLLMLDLSGNKLRGGIPPCIGNLTSLQALDLSSNQLSGNISSSIFSNLTSLEYLSLSANYFGGLFLMSSLANHSKLEVLALAMHGNRLQVETESPAPWLPSFQLKILHMPNCSVNAHNNSTIPSFLYHQQGLVNIDLSRNRLVGMLPTWLLYNNSELQVMILNDNSFTGAFQLPADPNKTMYQLHRLHISSNRIGGQLPQDIGLFLPNIESLDMSSNEFHGSIPPSFGGMSRLMILDLASNNFSGQVPGQLFSNCTSLVVLRLSDNSFHGQLFPSYWNLTLMRVLTLDNNCFSGTMQDGLVSSPELLGLDISGNRLSGPLPGWLANLQQLYVLSVSGNNLEGEIPQDLCKLNLEFINLSQNRLSGHIPSCLSKPSLKFIHLQGNKLAGSVPESFSERSNLVTLDLRDNQLTGNIPTWIHQLHNLKVLLLAGNHLGGQLPSRLCQLQKLSFVDLSHNNFTGSIPLCLSNVSFGQKEDNNGGKTFMTIPICLGFPGRSVDIYDYAHFDLGRFSQDPSYITSESGGHEVVEFTTKSRSLSYEGSILNYMSGLDLSCNRLSGEIPEQMGDLIGIRALNLSRNYLSSSIPASLSKLANLESLDLSYNNLGGQIPPQLDQLHSLAIFNVSYNHLSGVAPSKGQFATFDESSYIGNTNLHWTLVNGAPPTPSGVKYEDDDEDTAIEMVSFYWSFCTSFVMVLLALVTVFCINPYWKALWFHFINKCVHWLLKDALY